MIFGEKFISAKMESAKMEITKRKKPIIYAFASVSLNRISSQLVETVYSKTPHSGHLSIMDTSV